MKIFSASIIKQALWHSLTKLSFKQQIRNPIIFTVYIGSYSLTALWLYYMLIGGHRHENFTLAMAIFLWFTVLFANFSEAIAEGRGRAQAESLKKSKSDIQAKKIDDPSKKDKFTLVPSNELRAGDIVFVQEGDFIPADGEIIEGIASVNESAITGESAPVIRESGGDRSAVTGGTFLLSDWIVVKVTANPGETFLDRMISLVEGAQRQKTPNEISLSVLLASFTIIFLIASATLLPFSIFSVKVSRSGYPVSVTDLVALFVCLAPTTIGGLLSAIGIAGMDRLLKKNILANSARAVEAAGDVDTLLLDKTGTITLGNRQASEFIPASGISVEELANVAQLTSLTDETPEGRSIVILAKERYNLRGREIHKMAASFIPFSAKTRMSGVDIGKDQYRKGAVDAIEAFVKESGGSFPSELKEIVDQVAQKGGTPLVVAQNNKALGVIYLKDIVKGGMKERFNDLRKMGIKTIMVTGDNPLTASAIALESGVDDFLANATPEKKLEYIRSLQASGHFVAMTGDGTNDAPALAQADVALAMNSGTQAAKEAGNMVDLDSNPTKLIEVVEIGKQLLMTRGALTTFSISNDIAKYFAILPAAFALTYPELNILNFTKLYSPTSAIASAVIYNALIIIALVPIAIRGIHFKHTSAIHLLRKNIVVYGIGGILVPFIGIKLIDLFLVGCHLV